MNDASFIAAINAAGIPFQGPIIGDGKLHRFHVGGDKAGSRNGWYVFHADGRPAGAYGCWKRGVDETWCAGMSIKQTPKEMEIRRRRTVELERIRSNARVEARRNARELWDKSKPASDLHPYLRQKSVQAHDLRQFGGDLMVPICDADGGLQSIQRIAANGSKLFIENGAIRGNFFVIGDIQAATTICVAEGFATAASIYEATGIPTVAAMNSGNLKPVVMVLRQRLPTVDLLVCADDDQWTDGNPGLTKAQDAAKSVGARMVSPSFRDSSRHPTDFNDLHNLEGIDTVASQIAAAVEPECLDETVARLRELGPLDYDRVREKEAKRLGVRVSTLDDQVRGRREQSSPLQGHPAEFESLEPWPAPVSGSALLDEVSAVISRYVVLPREAADAIALWIAHAHNFDRFIHTPRLNLCSPEKGCGKTTLLDVIETLLERPIRTENLTTAVLFRLVDMHKPTLLLDEVDTYLRKNDELRGLLNGGHKRGACAWRCEGERSEVRGYSAFAPAVLAGIGALPSTLHDRSIVVRLIRAKKGEVSAHFDSRRTKYERDLCRQLARWSTDNGFTLETSDPVLPVAASNRLADNWRPLFAIAEIAGGDWPLRAAAAFTALTVADDFDAHGNGVALLADIKSIFESEQAAKLASAAIVDRLVVMEGRPWAEYGKHRRPISTNQLAQILRPFGVRPSTIRVGSETCKGYARDQFDEVFARYLQHEPSLNRNIVTCAENRQDCGCPESSQAQSLLPVPTAPAVNGSGRCDDVTAQNTLVPAEELVEVAI